MSVSIHTRNPTDFQVYLSALFNKVHREFQEFNHAPTGTVSLTSYNTTTMTDNELDLTYQVAQQCVNHYTNYGRAIAFVIKSVREMGTTLYAIANRANNEYSSVVNSRRATGVIAAHYNTAKQAADAFETFKINWKSVNLQTIMVDIDQHQAMSEAVFDDMCAEMGRRSVM